MVKGKMNTFCLARELKADTLHHFVPLHSKVIQRLLRASGSWYSQSSPTKSNFKIRWHRGLGCFLLWREIFDLADCYEFPPPIPSSVLSSKAFSMNTLTGIWTCSPREGHVRAGVERPPRRLILCKKRSFSVALDDPSLALYMPLRQLEAPRSRCVPVPWEKDHLPPSHFLK